VWDAPLTGAPLTRAAQENQKPKVGNYSNEDNNHRSLLTILRSRSVFILIAPALSTLAFVQRTEAVDPPPNGGYPAGNTAEGQAALLDLTSGTFNTALALVRFSPTPETTYDYWRRGAFKQHHRYRQDG
jgi:hypothetical protein